MSNRCVSRRASSLDRCLISLVLRLVSTFDGALQDGIEELSSVAREDFVAPERYGAAYDVVSQFFGAQLSRCHGSLAHLCMRCPQTPEFQIPHQARLYVTHLQILRKLEAAHDQTIQPQKRQMIRGLLDAVIVRTVEYRRVSERAAEGW